MILETNICHPYPHLRPTYWKETGRDRPTRIITSPKARTPPVSLTIMISVGTFNLLQDTEKTTFVLQRAGAVGGGGSDGRQGGGDGDGGGRGGNNLSQSPPLPFNTPTTQAPHQTAADDEIQFAKYAKRLDAYFDRFFSNVAAVSTLGSSVTFALIVSQLQDPLSDVASKHIFDLSTVRILIATSWLLFTTTLIFSFLLAGMLKWWRSHPNSSVNDGFWILGLLYVLLGGAFLGLSLAVAAYVHVVGFIAVAVIASICLLPVAALVVALVLNRVEPIQFIDHIFLTAGPLRE